MSGSETNTRRYRVYAIDDHPIVLHGMRWLLNEQEDMEYCGGATSIEAAMEELSNLRPDLILLDISLAGKPSIEFMKEITKSNMHVKVLVHSMHDERLYAERCLRNGAVGYVQKGEESHKVLDAIRRIRDGRIYLSPGVADLVFRRSMGQGVPDGADTLTLLSDRELMVFEFIGRGLTIREIAHELNLSRKTVETYREHIRTKMKLRTSNQLFREAVLWVHGQRDETPVA